MAYDHPGGLAPLFDDAGKDRTYTDTELQELLSFVENMDNATSADERARPPVLPVPVPEKYPRP